MDRSTKQQETGSIDPQRVSTVLDRIKYLMFLSRLNQTQFSAKLGMNGGNFSKIMSGKAAVSTSLINRIVADLGVSKPWLQYGQGLPFDKPLHAREISVGIDEITRGSGSDYYSKNDLQVVAGTDELTPSLGTIRPSGSMRVPGVSPNCTMVQIQGDSMQPTVQPGAMVAVSPVPPGTPIMWGQIYIVETDGLRAIKYLRKASDPENVILHSENPSYDDVEIAVDSINHLFLVEAIINFRNF